jgi:hypothetical protein
VDDPFRMDWHIEYAVSHHGTYLRCTVCGESSWSDGNGNGKPVVLAIHVADFAVAHDHDRSIPEW